MGLDIDYVFAAEAINGIPEVGDIVYYIPSHMEKTLENAEEGVVSTVDSRGIWVRYTSGDTGAKTELADLYNKEML